MKHMLRQHERAISALLFLLFGAAWIAFAPTQLGGQAIYVIVNGSSMEPGFHRGDLAILREAASYQIGEVVPYRHPDIGPVIHRIIGRDGDRYIFKGDNNNFIDTFQPVQADLMGLLWIHLPGVGAIIERLRTPWLLSLLATIAGVACMAPLIGNQQRQGGRSGARRSSTPPLASARAGTVRDGLMSGLTLLAALCCILGLFAFTRSATRAVPDDVAYEQRGAFSYSAAMPPGLYDTTAAQTGEPVFLQLARLVQLQFSYHLSSQQPAELSGTYRLLAEVRGFNGWKRTFELQPEQAFSGDSVTFGGALDLAQAASQIEHLQQQTGLKHQQYIVSILPQVAIGGTLAGQEFHEAFAPRLEFQIDEIQLQLAPASGDARDPLKPAKSGLLKRTRSEPNTLKLLGIEAGIAQLRIICLGGLALTIVGMLALRLTSRAPTAGQAAHIGSRYERLMVQVEPGDLSTGERAIAVASIAELAKLAERGGQVILHQAQGSLHRYTVQDSAATYCYTLVDAHPAAQPAGRLEQAPLPQVSASHVEPALPVAAEWQKIFLQVLREKGIAAEASREAGVRLAAAYQERERAPAFARAWNEARDYARNAQQAQERLI